MEPIPWSPCSYRTTMLGKSAFTVDSRYTNLRPIGRGAYGLVASAEDVLRGGSKVAIKKMSRVFDDLVDAKRIMREMELLLHFSGHANIVQLLDIMTGPPGAENALVNGGGGNNKNTKVFEDFNIIYIVTELRGCDLERVLASSQTLSEPHASAFIYQALRGLKYVHSAGVLHRDIKPSNLLVNADCELAIADFGLARGVRGIGGGRMGSFSPSSSSVSPPMCNSPTGSSGGGSLETSGYAQNNTSNTQHTNYYSPPPSPFLLPSVPPPRHRSASPPMNVLGGNSSSSSEVSESLLTSFLNANNDPNHAHNIAATSMINGAGSGMHPINDDKNCITAATMTTTTTSTTSTSTSASTINTTNVSNELDHDYHLPGATIGNHDSIYDKEPPLTQYVVTRWYRAPELLCEAAIYDTAVDVWSLGCVLFEILGRRILFKGSSPAHQLAMILHTLGSPSEEDIVYLACVSKAPQSAIDALRTLPATKPVEWKAFLPSASDMALDLLSKMLTFSPADRITVQEALDHPFFEAVRKHASAHLPGVTSSSASTSPVNGIAGGERSVPDLHPACPYVYDFSFERAHPRVVPKQDLQLRMLEAVATLRPPLRSNNSSSSNSANAKNGNTTTKQQQQADASALEPATPPRGPPLPPAVSSSSAAAAPL